MEVALERIGWVLAMRCRTAQAATNAAIDQRETSSRSAIRTSPAYRRASVRR